MKEFADKIVVILQLVKVGGVQFYFFYDLFLFRHVILQLVELVDS